MQRLAAGVVVDAAEDVHYAGTSNRVYSLTENAGDRVVFAIDGASVGLEP